VSASFVLSPDHQGILLSARSSGDVNVQLISEMLGGGGNAASAGAQLPGKTLEEAYQILIDAINQYLGAAETGPEPS
jgi:c-di-AMP phosphodiesterase-like protein